MPDGKRIIHDNYPTPYGLVSRSLKLFFLKTGGFKSKPVILDPGCGDGRWGEVYTQNYGWLYDSNLYGIDIREDIVVPECYREVRPGTDYLEARYFDGQFDLVMGNPPFKYAEEFVRKALQETKTDGHVLFLLRLAFLASQSRGTGLFQAMPPKYVWVSSRRPSFFSSTPGRKTTDKFEVALFAWQKGWHGATQLDWFMWEYDEEKD